MNNKYLNVPCAFHPHEIVTSFCHTRECLLPLCRTCIPIHQREHSAISEPPQIGDVFALMDKVRSDIHYQKEELRRKYPLVAKQLKHNQEHNRQLMAEVERERDELLAVLTERYNGILGHIVAQFDLRQNDLMNLHGTLETVESTLVSIEETLYRGKAMRSVIMWESQNLHKQGLESLRKLELELNVQKKPERVLHPSSNHERMAALNQLLNDRVALLEGNSHIDTKPLAALSTVLTKVVGGGSQEGNVDTERKSETRKSLNRLRNSGISLTEMNRQENKRSGLAAVRTPEKSSHPSTLVTVRHDIKPSGQGVRLLTTQSRELKKRSEEAYEE